MIFGLPIVYNPIMLIPFICAPLVAVILTYGAMVIGFLPAFGACRCRGPRRRSSPASCSADGRAW